MCYLSGKEMYFILCFQKSTVRKKSSRRVILKVHPWINSSSIALECTRNANTQVPGQTYKIRHSGIEVQQSVFYQAFQRTLVHISSIWGPLEITVLKNI